MIDHSRLTALFVQRVREQQQSISDGAMLRPSNDLHTTGIMAGRWQGLQTALDILEGILNDDAENERNRS